MKIAIVFLVVIACVMAGPLPALLKHVELYEENSYMVEYELDDGTVVKEYGRKVHGPEGDVWTRSGSFRYISPEGIPIELNYAADENGFQAQGDHLPTTPKPEH